MKISLLDVIDEVCGYCKGKEKHSETWWWNDVAVALDRKTDLFQIWKRSGDDVLILWQRLITEAHGGRLGWNSVKCLQCLKWVYH